MHIEFTEKLFRHIFMGVEDHRFPEPFQLQPDGNEFRIMKVIDVRIQTDRLTEHTTSRLCHAVDTTG